MFVGRAQEKVELDAVLYTIISLVELIQLPLVELVFILNHYSNIRILRICVNHNVIPLSPSIHLLVYCCLKSI